jgi:hypothetical protein
MVLISYLYPNYTRMVDKFSDKFSITGNKAL